MVTGRMALSYEGIAADDAGRLYLGRGGKIEVYEAGQKVSTITPHVDKSFLFTVRDGQRCCPPEKMLPRWICRAMRWSSRPTRTARCTRS